MYINLPEMAKKVRSVVQRSLASFVDLDAEAAILVCKEYGEVDRMRLSFREMIKAEIHRNPKKSAGLLELSSLIRHLERLADIATSVAEKVNYIVNGIVIRHIH